MRTQLSRALAVGAIAAGLLLSTGAPAAAQTTIDINPGNVPSNATDFPQNCDPNLGGGPYPGEDVWVFNLPGDPETSGVFESVTATFDTPDGPLTVTIPDDGGAIVNNMGTSKAWIRVPAGATLVEATAVISGMADFFVLSSTCAALQPTPTPTATPTQPPTPTPTPTATPTQPPTPTPTATPTQPPTPTPTATSSVQPTPTKTHLPVTGVSSSSTLVPLVTLGVGAILMGATLLGLRRRRG
ncbi:LPXTG cell wall anchor domain-containing protein [Micromonospora inyonensis]|uniref:LPXTG-motif cell wall anchor domain-containing protein n=1 Tax=Micromonospora inyonensis TaxID=47866 RepID=A0A1C6RMZ6_9ACTN|nr:LPXTG cell wall anchor domain-containing protein [Micromonospora inyonensis]SCL18426.1 LPXTG-motif cell wall anchor domain-containing protein [Micromonospora inyonensis]